MGAFRRLILGGRIDPENPSVFHKLSLAAFFAWIGLGADGLSSSCYGPAEAYQTLGEHGILAVFVGLATALTIFIISACYSQIIDQFPHGGGGYVVASKLISPTTGMVSGCALTIDYIMTITLSVASGADAMFSFLPPWMHQWRLTAAVAGVVGLTLLNLRGVKDSIAVLAPIFLTFVASHALLIVVGATERASDLPALVADTGQDLHRAVSQMGLAGTLLLILRAYGMGAGTFTGIEAVSNGLPLLREPKAHTGKRTMLYMAVSLSVTVIGLIVGYILFDVRPVAGKTLNAVLFESVTSGWGTAGVVLVFVTLISEAAILFVAAQAGFMDGPRVMANMARDRWLPTKFSLLSDRLVTQNGILFMGGSALVLMLATHGAVDVLLVLYSINVFITFVLSQLGMVRHALITPGAPYRWRRLVINGLGLVLTSAILTGLVVIKFGRGGWATLVITGLAACFALLVKRHYNQVHGMIRELDKRERADAGTLPRAPHASDPRDPWAKTAAVFVNGYNGLGLHALREILATFHGVYENFVFVQVGVVDSGAFKGADELERLHASIEKDLATYVDLMRGLGYRADAFRGVGVDVVEEIDKLVPEIRGRYPDVVFFGGQLVLPRESFWTRLLHNYVTFSVQRRLYREGIPFVILPVVL